MTADMIGAARRVLVCRTGRLIRTDTLLVVDPPAWLSELVG
jgi:hypothetical protein